MRQDFRDENTATTHVADVAVIGAGAAGITLARALRGSGRRILLVEAGGLEPDAVADDANTVDVLGHPFPGAVDGRARVLGGATTLWGGQSLPFDPIDFEARDWVPFSGWPIPHEAVAPYYPAAEQLLCLSQMAYAEDGWRIAGVEPPPFDPERIGCQLSWLSRRKDFARLYGAELEAAADITLLLNAATTALHADEAGARITHATVRSTTGRQGRIEAGVFVIATGAIETARLLLASPAPDGSGIGNRRDVVGRYFQDHPSAHALTIEPTDFARFARYYRPHERRHYRLFPKVPLAPAVQRADKVLNATAEIVFHPPEGSPFNTVRDFYRSVGAGRFEARPGTLAAFAGLLKELPRNAREILDRRTPTAAGSAVTLWAHIEQAPNPQSRITLTDARDAFGEPRAAVDWRLTELEQRTFAVFARTVADEFARTGLARSTLPEWLDAPDWRREVADFYHHMGGARMGTDRATSVVDADLRVHDVANLHVAGAAVFPTGSASNPTLTLLALTLRLADHLKN